MLDEIQKSVLQLFLTLLVNTILKKNAVLSPDLRRPPRAARQVA